MSIHYQDFDKSVSNIIEKWVELTQTEEEQVYKRALSRFVIPSIYNEIRKNIFHQETPITIQKKKLLPLIVKFIFSSLWAIKWIYFITVVKNKKVIICSFNLSQRNSVQYLKSLREFAKVNNYKIVHFNSSLKLADFIDLNLFCFPYSLFHYFFKNNFPYNLFNSVTLKIDELINNEIKINVKTDQLFSDNFIVLHKMHLSFIKMLHSISSANSINLYLSDGDFSSNRVLFNYECSKNNITTVCIDHSIIFNSNFHLYSFSDYYFSWGLYQKKRINNSYLTKPKGIFIIGKPDSHSQNIDDLIDSKNIIYFLPSFNQPLFQTINRSFDYSIKVAKKVQSFLWSNFPEYRFYLRPHPADNLEPKIREKQFKLWDNKLNKNEFVSLALVEDSSVIIDLLDWKSNIIYIKDNAGNDNVGLDKLRTAYSFQAEDDFGKLFAEIIGKSVDEKMRIVDREYFIGSNYKINYDHFLNLILENKSVPKVV